MKALRFLKRVGIAAVPILAVIMVTLVFYGILTLASNTVHCEKLYQELFTSNKMLATYWVLASIVASFLIYPNLLDWAKAKIRQMDTEVSKADEQEDCITFMIPTIGTKTKVSYQLQDWYHVRRCLISEVWRNDVYGTLHLDIPKQHAKESDPFWKDCDAFIWALFVDDCAREDGVARKMMREAEDMCVMYSCLSVGLRWDDRESEPWVLAWYQRRGYNEIRVEEDGHAHFLVKDLSDEYNSGSSSNSNKNNDVVED